MSLRLKKLPPYLFAEIDRTKQRLRAEGLDLIDLGIGDPDQPTPQHIIDKLCEAVKDPTNHRYALDQGLWEFRKAISNWYKRRFNVDLDPYREIQPLIGSKEGIAHLPLAFLNAGDIALIPDPGYPPYKSGTILAEGKPYPLPLLPENNFLPELKKIPSSILKKAKILFLNYPNNPTTAISPEDYFKKVIGFAQKNKILICHDAAYSEISFDGYSSPSFLQFKGAKEVGIEFHSLSKTYNMTGWRIGWVCGNRKAVEALGRVKTNIDSGIFQAIQIAGISALEGDQSCVERMKEIYKERRDALIEGLKEIGWEINKPLATFYVWARLPKPYKSSIKFAKLLLENAHIVVTPGIGFGEYGEGFVRFSLTNSIERIKEAMVRMKKVL
ncbi:MAG: LL-diaminopimelate aminotransferase [Candidatus Omnitrophota bacterium]